MSGTRTLYLRSLPEQVVRHAKVEAARQGITLAQFVADAIEGAVRGEEPDAELPENLVADAAWYEEHKGRLLKRYEGEYLAILDGEVADHDPDFTALSDRVFAEHGPRPIFMPRCIEADEVVHVRGPRTATS